MSIDVARMQRQRLVGGAESLIVLLELEQNPRMIGKGLERPRIELQGQT